MDVVVRCDAVQTQENDDNIDNRTAACFYDSKRGREEDGMK